MSRFLRPVQSHEIRSEDLRNLQVRRPEGRDGGVVAREGLEEEERRPRLPERLVPAVQSIYEPSRSRGGGLEECGLLVVQRLAAHGLPVDVEGLVLDTYPAGDG